MIAKVYRFNQYRPQTYTSQERLLSRLRTEIFACGRSYADIAEEAYVHPNTVMNVASGKTRWPRDYTLFGLIKALNLDIRLERKRRP